MKIIRTLIVAVAVLAASTANAQSIGDLLKGLGNGSSTIGNVIEGVFTKSDLTLQDIEGEYESTGPAVAFKGDNFLKKAGGVAAAAALETKLAPYFKQYGLTGMKLEVDSAANFTMTIKGVKLMGDVICNQGQGTFTFNIKVAGKMKLGQFTAYVEKSGKNLNLMFDATKLKELISMIGRFSGSKLTSTVSSLLDSYDGACIGFKMSCIKEPEKEESGVGSAIGNLLNAIKKK